MSERSRRARSGVVRKGLVTGTPVIVRIMVDILLPALRLGAHRCTRPSSRHPLQRLPQLKQASGCIRILRHLSHHHVDQCVHRPRLRATLAPRGRRTPLLGIELADGGMALVPQMTRIKKLRVRPLAAARGAGSTAVGMPMVGDATDRVSWSKDYYLSVCDFKL